MLISNSIKIDNGPSEIIKDTINKITELNEGILGSIARMFMTSKLKSKYKKAYKIR